LVAAVAASPELEPVPEQPPLVESEAPVAVKEVESPELEPVPEQFQKEEQPEAVPHQLEEQTEAVPYQVGEQPEAAQVEVVMAAASQVQAKGPEQFPSAELGAVQEQAVRLAAP